MECRETSLSVPDETGTGSLQQAAQQTIDVPDLDAEPLDDTPRVVRANATQSNAIETGSLSRVVRLESERVRSTRTPCAATSAPERVWANERHTDAAPSTETSVCATDRTNNSSSVRVLNATMRPAVTYAPTCLVVEYIAPLNRVRSDSIDERICDIQTSDHDKDGVQTDTRQFSRACLNSKNNELSSQRRMLDGNFVVDRNSWII